MKVASAVLAALAATLVVGTLHAQLKERPIPRLINKDGRFALLVDDAPYLMLGAQVHNSSDWPAMFPKVWPTMEYLNVNTVEIPVYWEQLNHGRDSTTTRQSTRFSLRPAEHHIRLVLLRFGAWKNSSQRFMPEWMKLAPDRYPHMVDQNRRAVDSPSPYATRRSTRADAVHRIMRPLKTADPQHTAIMVQVENETGAWAASAVLRPPPETLRRADQAEVLNAMQVKAARHPDSQEAFGPKPNLLPRLVGRGRCPANRGRGKAVYPLPLYANAAFATR